jgi:FkbM family methyltransferase
MGDDYIKFMEKLNDEARLLSRGSILYDQLEKYSLTLAERHFDETAPQEIVLTEWIGNIKLPYFKMGAINSTHLFGIDELLIFNFYQNNVTNYVKVADVGANIGLHSIILNKLGFEVRSYEPDPIHFQQLIKNASLNKSKINAIQSAVSTHSGKAQFTRVLGNTTGSHLAGIKDSYGDRENFDVELKSFKEIITWADLVKMDVEGHESELIESIDFEGLKSTDIILEIGNVKNAKDIFEHIKLIGGCIYCQKINWKEAVSVEDLPTSHREGSAFITNRKNWTWESR